MASYQGNERAKMEQIITEFFAKSLHIILESRCPYVSSRNYSGEQVLSSPSSSSSSSSSVRPRDKWFNLALRDCPAALENIDFWRQSNLEPMIVDVILSQRPIDWDPLNFSPRTGNSSGKDRYYYSYGSDNDESGCEGKNEKIIERWVLQYESKKSGVSSSSSGNKRSNSTSSHALYKKSILLLRSLYATVRLLPAYKLFRDLTASPQIHLYNLGHRVSSFVEPFTRREEADMQRFVFTPVDTSCGRLCLSVVYRSSVVDTSSDPSTPISPQFIPEYVGSPMAEPLKRFPSGFVSQSSPSSSSSPFGRRHSWSYDLYRASPPSVNPSPSPSPTYSDSHASLAKQRCRRLPPPPGLPYHLPDETHITHSKNPSYDEYWPSPVFSTSPSPSPPTYVSNSHITKVLLRSESAPVSIPVSRLSSMPSLPNKLLMPPEKIAHAGPHQKTATVDKLLFSKDKPQKISGVRPSWNSSSSKSFSSRLSFQDDYDDGPFVVDDEELVDPGSRSGLFEQPGYPSRSNEPGGTVLIKRSQDAAVGALVRMLKKAPPLHQDTSVATQDDLQGSKLQTATNSIKDATEMSGDPRVQRASASNLASSGLGLITSKTTANALEELHGYRKIKDSLLNSK